MTQYLFDRIIIALDTLGICYQAYEDLSIRLLSDAPNYLVQAIHYLSAING